MRSNEIQSNVEKTEENDAKKIELELSEENACDSESVMRDVKTQTHLKIHKHTYTYASMLTSTLTRPQTLRS
jgi:hypothetical protein